jgi:hypothetical protein
MDNDDKNNNSDYIPDELQPIGTIMEDRIEDNTLESQFFNTPFVQKEGKDPFFVGNKTNFFKESLKKTACFLAGISPGLIALGGLGYSLYTNSLNHLEIQPEASHQVISVEKEKSSQTLEETVQEIISLQTEGPENIISKKETFQVLPLPKPILCDEDEQTVTVVTQDGYSLTTYAAAISNSEINQINGMSIQEQNNLLEQYKTLEGLRQSELVPIFDLTKVFVQENSEKIFNPGLSLANLKDASMNIIEPGILLTIRYDKGEIDSKEKKTPDIVSTVTHKSNPNYVASVSVPKVNETTEKNVVKGYKKTSLESDISIPTIEKAIEVKRPLPIDELNLNLKKDIGQEPEVSPESVMDIEKKIGLSIKEKGVYDEDFTLNLLMNDYFDYKEFVKGFAPIKNLSLDEKVYTDSTISAILEDYTTKKANLDATQFSKEQRMGFAVQVIDIENENNVISIQLDDLLSLVNNNIEESSDQYISEIEFIELVEEEGKRIPEVSSNLESVFFEEKSTRKKHQRNDGLELLVSKFGGELLIAQSFEDMGLSFNDKDVLDAYSTAEKEAVEFVRGYKEKKRFNANAISKQGRINLGAQLAVARDVADRNSDTYMTLQRILIAVNDGIVSRADEVSIYDIRLGSRNLFGTSRDSVKTSIIEDRREDEWESYQNARYLNPNLTKNAFAKENCGEYQISSRTLRRDLSKMEKSIARNSSR